MTPETIGPFTLQERLGAGGMGEVFRAHDARLDRLVAIKRLRVEVGQDARFLERFRREARTVARLNHPAIVQVHDVLSEGGDEWIVMEYVEGRTLRSWLAGGPLEPPQAVALAREIAEGLAEAHDKGVVHRDLKSENVIVTPDGHAKIVDFGIAKHVTRSESDASLTASRTILGTYRAMSPEQVLGEPVTPRSDLFSLGVLLYEALSGQSPFAHDNPARTMSRIVQERQPPLTELRPDVPASLSRLVDHLLEKDPEARPRDAHEVARALASWAPDGADEETAATDAFKNLYPPLPGDTTAGEVTTAAAERILKCLLMIDLVDSTLLFATLGDARASRVAARHDRLARDLLGELGGREIDKTDGFLMLFERPIEAVRYAVAYHRRLDELSAELGVALAARSAIHLGELFLWQNPAEDVARGAKPVEVEGLAKPTTARLLSLAQGRQTLLTRGVFDLARGAATSESGADPGLRWLAHGSYLLQGLGEPIEVFEVGEPSFAPLSAPADSDKARRASTAEEQMLLGWRPAPEQLIPGRRSWMLCEKLGEGGFGEVWLAADGKTEEKRVFKFCFSADRLRALRREVVLFRLLKESLGHRDDIARILNWSFDEPPYSVESEYTAGGSLPTWAREQGGIGAVPLATRLELVAQVAGALAAAHSVGVLHKDVKPENVLIAADRHDRPRAVLTDFGIGLVTDRSLLEGRGITAFGVTELLASAPQVSTSGTRLYLAPELMEGKPATIQADVYALGVLLYQVVAGNLAHALAPGWQRDVDDELLREDIACFVDGSPERRPRSAAEVAERLRSLDERRRRRRAAEREREAARRARRRRKVVSTVAAVASVVLLVVSLLAIQAMSARREADRRRQQAEQLISFMLGDLRTKLSPLGRLDILDDVGEQALAYFDAVPAAQLTDEELFRRSQAQRQIGEVWMQQGTWDAAGRAFEESLKLAQEAVRRDPGNADWQAGLGASHFWIGNLRRRQGDLDGSLEHFRAYLALSQDLAAREPDRREWQLELAYAHNNVGLVLKDRGELREALDELRLSLAIKERLAASAPDNPEWQISLGVGYSLVGSVLDAMGELRGALKKYREQLAIMQALVARDPRHSGWQTELTTCQNLIGHLYMDLGDLESADTQFRASVVALENLVAHDPSNRDWQWRLALARSGLSRLLVARDRTGDALAQLAAAEKVVRDQLAADADNARWRHALATIETRIAVAREAHGDAGGALVAVHEALAILEPAAGEDPDNGLLAGQLGTALLAQGRAWRALGQTEKARGSWERAVGAVARFAHGSRNRSILTPYVKALLHLNRVEEARPILDQLFDQGYREPGLLKLDSATQTRPSVGEGEEPWRPRTRPSL